MSDDRVIPPRPGLDAKLPEWILTDFKEFDVEPTRWEAQQIKRVFRSADRELRDAYDRIGAVLQHLHSGRPIDPAHFHNAAGSVVLAAGAVAELGARVDGAIHRTAEAER